MATNLYKVAIIGRVNVGKSTLFNRLISEKKAIISPVSGTTRDRNYAVCSWKKLDFNLIDTGGLEDSQKEMNKAIKEQVNKAILEADLILFIVDSKTGIMPTDKEITKLLQKTNKPIILVANKSDNKKLRDSIAEFYKLNIGNPLPISAHSGSGTGDLLDEVVKILNSLKKPNKRKKEVEDNKIVKVAIIGKPNVGKSSLINSLVGEERVVVSSQAHTTRDSQDIEITYNKQRILFIDTAGLRKKSRKSVDAFEKQSVEQSLKSIEKVDIVLFMNDISKKLTFQDKHLLDIIISKGKGLILLANKWDLIPDKDTNTAQEYIKYYKRFFPFLNWAPLLFISATEKHRISKVLETIISVNKEQNRTITENALDKLLKSVVKKHKPSRGKGTKHPYIYSIKQVDINPPTFAVKTNYKAIMQASYLKFIENNLRYKFNFQGTPLKLYIEKLKTNL